jgi:hypothetical protein
MAVHHPTLLCQQPALASRAPGAQKHQQVWGHAAEVMVARIQKRGGTAPAPSFGVLISVLE